MSEDTPTRPDKDATRPADAAGASAPRRGRAGAIAAWVAGGIVVLLVLFIGVARATDSSSFCKTCHEMAPYYDAWTAGAHGHKDVACVECHVDHGAVPRLAHKFVALGEVWNHFFGTKTFPLQMPAKVPNSRCTRCHPHVNTTLRNFSHALHAAKGTCQQCHPTAGHMVTEQALRAAGAFNPNAQPKPFTRKVAIVNGGRANAPGHVNVVCSRCHDMKATGCNACHKAPDNAQHKTAASDCSICHKAGGRFVFNHPGTAADCPQCHKVPAKHPAQAANKPCALCHLTGTTWTFRHPGADARCLDCHSTPAAHPAVAQGKPCPLCHVAGGSWSLRHPGASNTDCASCHKPPANHFGSQCSACHHQPGVTWAFLHPAAGAHSWRSFDCIKCHPSSYTRAFCSCHGGNPPSD